MAHQAKKKAKVQRRPDIKDKLRAELKRMNIPYLEKDSSLLLLKKLQQAKMPVVVDEAYPVIFDQMDDQMIINEMKGQLSTKFVYSFEVSGQKVTGLSKAGVADAWRRRANHFGEVARVMEPPTIRDDGPEHIVAMVKVGRYRIFIDKKTKRPAGEVLLDTTIGTKRQWRKYKARDGRIYEDPFFMEKAVSKAERNGKLTELDCEFKEDLVREYLTQKGQPHVQQITAKTKVGESQLKYLHGIGMQYLGIKDYKKLHEEITRIARQAFGYSTLNEVDVDQVNVLAAKIKAMGTKGATAIPITIIGVCNAKGILPAKREAMWAKCMEIAKGNLTEAIELMGQEVDRTRADDEKQ